MSLRGRSCGTGRCCGQMLGSRQYTEGSVANNPFCPAVKSPRHFRPRLKHCYQPVGIQAQSIAGSNLISMKSIQSLLLYLVIK